jgi:hypothetical protein
VCDMAHVWGMCGACEDKRQVQTTCWIGRSSVWLRMLQLVAEV